MSFTVIDDIKQIKRKGNNLIVLEKQLIQKQEYLEAKKKIIDNDLNNLKRKQNTMNVIDVHVEFERIKKEFINYEKDKEELADLQFKLSKDVDFYRPLIK